MQPARRLLQTLEQLATPEQCLFTPNDLRAALPELSDTAFKTVLSRLSKQHYLTRICRGIYLFEKAYVNDGRLLFYVAARLRANDFSYISLETALSDAGVISQIPINTITLLTSGRSNIIHCGRWGKIEFIHTRLRAEDLVDQIFYDDQCKLWRASVAQALRDMRNTRRSTDLIDWDVAHELI